MRYQLTPINTRPWLLNGLSLRLIESHYENHYGGALRRLNAITEQLESLDFDKTPGYVVNSLKREQLIALNSTLAPRAVLRQHGIRRWKAERGTRSSTHPRLRISGSLAQ